MSNTAYRPLSDSFYESNEQTHRMERRSSNGLPKRHWQLAKALSKKRTILIILILLLTAVYFTWGAVVLPSKEADDNIASITAGRNAHPSRNKASGQALLLNILKKSSEQNPEKESKNNMSMNESVVVCSELLVDSRFYIRNQPQSKFNHLPMIYFITPTYSRREQVPDITRLAHTLMHVPRIHWIVADDSLKCNPFLGKLLMQFEIPHTLLCTPMPEAMRKKKFVPRGVSNRRLALQWIRKNNITSGVLYFGDDDNTYDLRLFSEIRETQRVSMLPVGLIQTYSISGPVVRKGKVVGFLDSWVAKRRWPVDMAGFAVNLAYLAEHPNATMPYKAGHEEDIFLRSIALHMDMIEPKANNCTEILVWHTQTKHADSPTLKIKHEYLDERSNLGKLLSNLKDMGMAYTNESEGLVASLSKNGEIKPFEYFFS